jgi:multiple sugar transport system permease protein
MSRSLLERCCWGLGGAAVVVQALLPVAWLVSLSLKPASDLADGRFLPRAATLASYRAIFAEEQFRAALVNSVGIASLATALAIGLAVFAAYAIARLDFPGRGALVAASLAIAMFPPIAIVGPLFDLWRDAGLFDTWPGLVIPYMSFTLPLAIWILSAFFRDVPWELGRAAILDGATPFQSLRHVIVPLAAPGVFAAAILVFVFAWNDFLFAISLTSTDRARTVPAALAFFSAESQFQQPTGLVAAASVVVTLPVVAVVLAFQRRIVAGLTSGAVKG